MFGTATNECNVEVPGRNCLLGGSLVQNVTIGEVAWELFVAWVAVLCPAAHLNGSHTQRCLFEMDMRSKAFECCSNGVLPKLGGCRAWLSRALCRFRPWNLP